MHPLLTPEEEVLLGQTIEKVEIHANLCGSNCQEALRAMGVSFVERGGTHKLTLSSPDQTNSVIDTLRQHGIDIIELDAHRASLEQLFLEKVHSQQEEAAQ